MNNLVCECFLLLLSAVFARGLGMWDCIVRDKMCLHGCTGIEHVYHDLLKVGNFPPCSVSECYYCWKDSVSSMATASTLTIVQNKSSCKNFSGT